LVRSSRGIRVEEPTVSGNVEEDVIAVAHAWDRAMVGNDPTAIGQYMADDWTIIGPDGSVGTRTTFLELVGSGHLSHDVMESHDLQVRVYGDTAVATGRGVSGGQYQGESFYLVERLSCVFVRQPAGWRCVLTHLSPIAQA
jgi:ketosteroid isomerase-like protein